MTSWQKSLSLKAIAVGSPTVGNSVLSSVAGWLDFLRELKFKNKKAAVFGTMAGLVNLQRSVKSWLSMDSL